MISRHLLTAAAIFLATISAAAALEVDDVARMAKADVGDEVILAQMQAARARFVLTADDIVRLKKEGVSDAVLKAMIESGRLDPAGAAPANAPSAPAGEAGTFAGRPAPASTGVLVLENLDSRDYSVQVDPEHRNVFFYKASAAEGREPLPARSSQVYRLPPGAYRLTWVAGTESHAIRVAADVESRATLTRTSAEGVEAVYLSLFEDGERRGGGLLVKLADNPPAQVSEKAPAQRATVIERHYYAVPAQQTCYREVAPERCYDRRDRAYSYGTRYSWVFPAFSYNWTRGRSTYGVGWGPYGDLGFSWHRQLGRSGYSLSWGW